VAAFRELPATALAPCEKRAARVSSTALVRYRGNDYAVPSSHGCQEVLVKGGVDHVVIVCAGQQIARHQRACGTGTFVFDPLHYLALIESKPNALDQAAPLQGWELPEVFQHMRHRLEARMGNRGKREFIAVLATAGSHARRRRRPGPDRAAATPAGSVGLSALAQD
jgi:hypothetical protein